MPVYSYKTILACVQDALVQLNQIRPIGVYDSTDGNAILMGSYANIVGDMLLDSFDWQQFRGEYEVIGDGVKTDFDLPDDFNSIVDNTGWSHANRRPVIVINAQQNAAIQAWVSKSFFINPAARIIGDKMSFVVPPALNERITFEYLTKFWALDEDGVTKKEQLSNNGDTPLFDGTLFTIALKIKWMQTRGMPTGSIQDEFNQRLSQVYNMNTMAGNLSLNGGSMTGFRYLNGGNMPDTGYGS